MEENITPHEFKILQGARNKRNGHKSFIIWFTGLSGSGKSTIANALEVELFNQGIRTYILDGDNIRAGINKNLTFSIQDRDENLRRIGEIAKLMIEAGLVVIAAFVSPTESGRTIVKDIVGASDFVEIFVNTSLEVCEKRDVKGLYKKAREGKISDFTGISQAYEAPKDPDIELTERISVEEAVLLILTEIKEKLQIRSCIA